MPTCNDQFMSLRLWGRRQGRQEQTLAQNRVAPSDGQGTRLTTTRAQLERITRADFSHAQAYGQNALGASSFEKWYRAAKNLTHPDQIRNALYYGFQPLYDALVKDDAALDGKRQAAVTVLDNIIDMSVNFLTSYYTGEPDVSAYQEDMRKLEDQMDVLQGVPYQTKSRNVDTKSIYAPHIKLFLQQFLEHAIKGQLSLPDYVLGNACGASEVAMPLAGILQTDVGFLRKSQARPDKRLRVIAEQEESIREHVNGRSVLCVEDYVDSGQSLEAVMERAHAYGAVSIIGTSVNFQHAGDRKRSRHLSREIGRKKFNIYRWR